MGPFDWIGKILGLDAVSSVILEEEDDLFGMCRCGNAWFYLEPPDEVEDDDDCLPAVCVDLDGNITGYAGKLVCIECAEDWVPSQEPASDSEDWRKPRLYLVK